MKYLSLIIPGLILSAWLTCEKSTKSEPWSGEYTLFQVPGCQSNALAKSFSKDSCFTYQFDTDLLIDFYVNGNCCPDSNRFDLFSEIRHDTIAITVLDTAGRGCWCICDYIIHAEFSGLLLDSYVIDIYADTDYDTLTYLEIVQRSD
ncbi:MAG: hypothetical protein HWN51_00445 [Desulfobacterales bacterium]|nr:hypothetical protein [Desulfobacterales bacterium]